MLYDLSLPLQGDIPEAMQSNESGRALIAQGHVGTHLDRPLGSAVPLDYFKSRAVLFDVSALARDREVRIEDIPTDLVAAGDFVMFRSGHLAAHGYGSTSYLHEYFELSWELVELLLERKVRFIGVDARGLRRNEEHRHVDEQCERGGAFVIENINNLELLPDAQSFTAYTVCFDAGGSGIPCRVVAETTDD